MVKVSRWVRKSSSNMPSSPTTVSWRRLAGVSQSTSSWATTPGREVEEPEQEVLVRGVDPLGRLRVDPRRPLAGDPAQDVDVVGGQVDGHADVADPGRERAGPPARDGVDGRQPARGQQAAELEDRRVEALDVADLDGHAPGAGRGDDPERLLDRAGQRLLDEDGDAALDRRQGEVEVGGRRRRDDERVELDLGDHRQRLGEALGADLLDGGGQRGRDRIGDRDERGVGTRGDDPQVVPAHRPEAGEADPQPAVAGRLPGARRPRRRCHEAGVRVRAASALGVATSRIAATTVRQLVVGQARPDGDRDDLVGQLVRDRQVQVGRAGHDPLQVGLLVDRHRVVEERPDAALGEAVDDLRPLAGEAHRVLVPDVLAAGRLGRREVPGEALGQVGRVAPPLCGALVEPGQLGEADRRDEVGRLVVRAERLVVVADPHPVVAEQADPVGQRVVVGRREAALAGHQVLRRVRAEHRRPELARLAAVVGRAVGLGGVLDDRQAVPLARSRRAGPCRP